MSYDSIKFTMYHLLLNSNYVERKDLQGVQDRYMFTGDDSASGIAQIENTSEYLWMYAHFGKNFPYSADILDIKTKEIRCNPRTPDEAELRQQEFCLYHYGSKLLYTSGSLDFFKRVLHEVNPAIKARHIYKTRQEFLRALKKVNSVRFIACEDLLTYNDDLFALPMDKLGLGNPNQIKVEFKFPYVKATKQFKDYLDSNFFHDYDCGKLKSLAVVGEYEDGDRLMAATFNLKNLVSTIFVNVSRSSSGMYSHDEIKSVLLAAIK